jgi:hypothetical protein
VEEKIKGDMIYLTCCGHHECHPHLQESCGGRYRRQLPQGRTSRRWAQRISGRPSRLHRTRELEGFVRIKRRCFTE